MAKKMLTSLMDLKILSKFHCRAMHFLTFLSKLKIALKFVKTISVLSFGAFG